MIKSNRIFVKGMPKQTIYLEVDDVLDLEMLLRKEGKENIQIIKLEQTDLGPDNYKLDISFK